MSSCYDNYGSYENDNYNNYILNGRVNLIDNNTTSYKIDPQNPVLYNEKAVNTISRIYTGNCVTETYFSKENIDIVQEGIINSVYNKTEGKYSIGRQSDQELLIVMRSIYLQYGKNLNFNINEQIRQLNTMVIRWCVDEIIKNINQYMNYKVNVSTLPMPMERAQLPSVKGTKTLEIKSFI
jgi:uncharacterized phage-associated protein